MNIRKVTVEILRAGPRHNQLLSPLTQYLAVCEDSPAGVVMLPSHYVQETFERRLGELRYEVTPDKGGAGRLRGVLHQTGDEIAEILGGIPGLPGALRSEPGARDTLTHLRIVSSASELAMLPFELSKMPAGAGASPDSWLCVHSPVCLTRHNRSVPIEGVKWPTKPRILFVAGPDVEEAAAEHERALRKALHPWTGDPEGDGWLTVQREANLTDIVQAMVKRPTHVHILAHGRRHEDDKHIRHGVHLVGGTVSGEQLASALTHIGPSDEHLPTVVTLATCDSGTVADVRPPDASVAHDLHERGIPFVVASQFPLSVGGSIPFAGLFYEKQLWGENPLQTIYEVRLRLHGPHASRFHDWASLTVYEALPSDFEKQLQELNYWQSRRAVYQALDRLEGRVNHLGRLVSPDHRDAWDLEYRELVDAVHATTQRLPTSGPYTTDCNGLRGAAWKRLAQVDWSLAATVGLEPLAGRLFDSCYENLQNSLIDYKKAMAAFFSGGNEYVHRRATLHWILIQVLSLSIVLDKESDEKLESWRVTANLSAQTDLDSQLGDGRAWAHVSLMELALLQLTRFDIFDDPEERKYWYGEALYHADRIRNLVPRDAEQVTSTIRQLRRYVDFYGNQDFDLALSGHLHTRDFGLREHWRAEREDGEGDGLGLVEAAKVAIWILGGVLTDIADDEQIDDADNGSVEYPPPPVAEAQPVSVRSPEVLSEDVDAEVAPDDMFDIEMLPAEEGDALWIEYGDPDAPHRVLIDCGRKATATPILERVEALGQVNFDLFVMTHVDRDHIEGAIPFLEQTSDDVTFDDVWFNGWDQIRDLLGVRQGDRFSDLLEEKGLPWNRATSDGKSSKPRPIKVPYRGGLQTFVLAGGMELTVLSPNTAGLKRLAGVYKRELKDIAPDKLLRSRADRPQPVDPHAYNLLGDADTEPDVDTTATNESSIAFLAEYGGRSVLFTGDAHPGVLQSSIEKLLAKRNMTGQRLRLDAHKISHHGSAGAITKELLSLTDCSRYLVTSNGKIHYHPDRPAIARIIAHGGDRPKLYFNYRSDFTAMWDDPILRSRYPTYVPLYPEDGSEGLRVSI